MTLHLAKVVLVVSTLFNTYFISTYNDGASENLMKWEVSVFDAAVHLFPVSALNNHTQSSCHYIRDLISTCKSQGFSVLSGARKYFSLVALQLSLSQPPDINLEIVINHPGVNSPQLAAW